MRVGSPQSVPVDERPLLRDREEAQVQSRPGITSPETIIAPSTWVILVTLVVVLSIWTTLIATTNTIRFNVFWPRARLPIETTGLVVAGLTAGLGYLRYSLSRSPSSLFLALAFTVLAVNHFVFGILITPGASGTGGQELYFWTVGRVLAVAFLFVGALPAFQEPRESPHPLRSYVTWSLVALGALAIAQGLLRFYHHSLPPLVDFRGSQATSGVLPGLTIVDLVLGASGTSLYLVAALIYVREVPGRYLHSPWLSLALVLAAFSHLHYMLFPTVFTDRISTGDLLRLAFAFVLLVGLVWEVRASFLVERERAADAAKAFRAERERAADAAKAFRAERQRVLELERLDRAKADFFNMVTHELIHPVAALRGFAVTLTKRWAQLDEETRLAMIDRMDKESVRLRDLAEEAGTVAYVEDEGFALHVSRERVADLARDAADAVMEMANRLVLQVAPRAEDAVANVDRPRLLQVFRNLLSNAEKYSHPGTTVQLLVDADEAEITFQVLDRGPGIAEEDFPRLFQRFSRIRAPHSASVPGSGLGLYISRRIVEAHGGRIWVDSSAGDGSCFGFSLPRAKD
jgi:signal transduction histidine kinase